MLETYGDRIRVVYRDFPLPNHPRATPAAEAALCAHEQGKFWEYHDTIFANQRALDDPNLKQFAADIGLDEAAFEACFDSRRFQERVALDYAEGGSLGVNATPAFFINGRYLSGAQPFSAFQQIIDEELSN